MLEKPRCTRACRVRSSYVSAFRSARAASEANAAMTSVSRSPNRRSSRAPAPSTPRVSPESTIGAKILLVNPSYASLGIAAAASAPFETTGLPRRTASAAAPSPAGNWKPTRSFGKP